MVLSAVTQCWNQTIIVTAPWEGLVFENLYDGIELPFFPWLILSAFLHEKHKMRGNVLYCLCPHVSSRKMIIWFRLNLVILQEIYNKTFEFSSFINFGLNVGFTLHEFAALLHWVGSLFLVSAVCCQVEVSALGWSLVQRSPTECRLCECDCEFSTVRGPGPLRVALPLQQQLTA